MDSWAPSIILNRSVTGRHSPHTPWSNLLGYIALLFIIFVVIWILAIIIQLIYYRLNIEEQVRYQAQYDQIF